MHPLAETLLNEPVIAAVKTDEALTGFALQHRFSAGKHPAHRRRACAPHTRGGEAGCGAH